MLESSVQVTPGTVRHGRLEVGEQHHVDSQAPGAVTGGQQPMARETNRNRPRRVQHVQKAVGIDGAPSGGDDGRSLPDHRRRGIAFHKGKHFDDVDHGGECRQPAKRLNTNPGTPMANETPEQMHVISGPDFDKPCHRAWNHGIATLTELEPIDLSEVDAVRPEVEPCGPADQTAAIGESRPNRIEVAQTVQRLQRLSPHQRSSRGEHLTSRRQRAALDSQARGVGSATAADHDVAIPKSSQDRPLKTQLLGFDEHLISDTA